MSNDVFLRCVLELSSLLALGRKIDLVKINSFCSEINRKFSLTLDPQGKGVLESVVFSNTMPTILQEISSNIKQSPHPLFIINLL